MIAEVWRQPISQITISTASAGVKSYKYPEEHKGGAGYANPKFGEECGSEPINGLVRCGGGGGKADSVTFYKACKRPAKLIACGECGNVDNVAGLFRVNGDDFMLSFAAGEEKSPFFHSFQLGCDVGTGDKRDGVLFWKGDHNARRCPTLLCCCSSCSYNLAH